MGSRETTDQEYAQPSTSKISLNEGRKIRRWASMGSFSNTKEQHDCRHSTSYFSFSQAGGRENQPSTSECTHSETTEQDNPQPSTSKSTFSGTRKKKNQPSASKCIDSETTEQDNPQPSTSKSTFSETKKRKKNNQPYVSKFTREQPNGQGCLMILDNSSSYPFGETTGESSTQYMYNPLKVAPSKTIQQKNTQASTSQSLVPGSLCWSKLDGHPWWPAMIIGGRESGCPDPGPDKIWVYWFGEYRISQVKVEKICSFAENFKSKWSKKGNKIYKKAVVECIKIQAKVMLRNIEDWSEEMCLEWAVEGFLKMAIQAENSCTWFKGVPPSIWKEIDDINEREKEANARKERRSNLKSKFGASTSSLHELMKPCLVGLERCDEVGPIKVVKMLTFNDYRHSAFISRLNYKVDKHISIDPFTEDLPEREKLLSFGPIDIFVGGASRFLQQPDAPYRHLFECYRIITVLRECNAELQWIFHSPLDVTQLFVDTAKRFMACKEQLPSLRVTRDQFLLWTNIPATKKLTNPV